MSEVVGWFYAEVVSTNEIRLDPLLMNVDISMFLYVVLASLFSEEHAEKLSANIEFLESMSTVSNRNSLLNQKIPQK